MSEDHQREPGSLSVPGPHTCCTPQTTATRAGIAADRHHRGLLASAAHRRAGRRCADAMMGPAGDRAVHSLPPLPAARHLAPPPTAGRWTGTTAARHAGHHILLRIPSDSLEPQEARAEVCGGHGGRPEQQQATSPGDIRLKARPRLDPRKFLPHRSGHKKVANTFVLMAEARAEVRG